MDNKLKKQIEKLASEEITIVPYNPVWPKMFKDETFFLRKRLPQNMIKRIKHFGSTAVIDLSAKLIIDILVEVTSLKETKKIIVPILESEGYEYFWRPAFGDDQAPFYAWFIKCNSEGQRTHHIHMVEADSELWDRIYFRDYLRQFPLKAKYYDKLKKSLSKKYINNRVRYIEEKSDFIFSITKRAKRVL